VTAEEIAAARRGRWAVQLTDTRMVPSDWFPEMLAGADILCLAAGGGQQGPILAAAGATVTVLDISPAQLEHDRAIAARETLALRTVVGDMADLTMFDDASFDLVFLPGANSYIDDTLPVWREAHRVLRPGGHLLAGFDNPLVYLFDYDRAWEGDLVVRHRIPYSDLDAVSEETRQRRRNADIAVEFGHTLDDQIGGQIAAGFVITGFFEDRLQDEPSSHYIANSAATRARKPVEAAVQPRDPNQRVGVHLILEGYHAPADLLDDRAGIERAIRTAVCAGGAHLLDIHFHKFEPCGVTAAALLAESHVNIHTWPERQYFAADLFFCGAGDPEQAATVLARELKTGRVNMQRIERSFAVPADPVATAPAPVPRWWFERGAPPSIVQALHVRQVHAERSPHQAIEIFEHDQLGRLLVLDGVVQATTADEFIYHEMLVQVPLNALPPRNTPATVLIIGGGDGGALREVLRHDWIEHVVMVELDPAVVRCSIDHLGIHGDFADPRVELVYADAAVWLEGAGERPFDVAIIDSPDRGGAGEILYAPRFYEMLAARLAPDGLVSQHLGVPGCQSHGITLGVKNLAAAFGGVQLYRAAVPTYIGGDMAFAVASRHGAAADLPLRDFSGRHYNPGLHRASFALPTWWREAVVKANDGIGLSMPQDRGGRHDRAHSPHPQGSGVVGCPDHLL
jgi:spermidine synthase